MTRSRNSSSSGREKRPQDSTSVSLIERLKLGDADSWQRLVFLYTPLVRWWCQRQGLHREDAKDVAQEVFRTTHQKAAGLYAGGFRSWLWKTTANKIRDLRRRERGKAHAAGGSDAQELLENLPADSSGDSVVPDKASELALLVRRAMELVQPEFEPRTWQAAWRVVVDQQRPKDVAVELGMSVGAVRTAKSRVLARLRQELGELLDGEAGGG